MRRETPPRVMDRAAEVGLISPLDNDLTDGVIEEMLFPREKSVTDKSLPDFKHIRKELLRNGVTNNLLQAEHCEECRVKGNTPLMYSQWFLIKPTEPEARDLFELIHKRRKKSSTIFCSQFRESEWYQQLCGEESTLADAIMDRITYDSYKIDIENADPSKDISMRKIYSMDLLQAK